MAKPAGPSDNDIVQQAVSTALEQLEKYALEEFKKLAADPKKKEELTAAVRKVAEDEVKQARDLRDCPESEIATRLGKHLPRARIQMIEKGLTIPTYKIELNKHTEGYVLAEITRDGEEFMPSVKLDTVQAIDSASFMQMASIIVEAVLLVMSAVGIGVDVGKLTIQNTAKEVATAVQNSSLLQQAVEGLEKAFGSGGSAWDQAKAIFFLIKDCYSVGILWTIINSLCQNMSWFERAKAFALVSTMIIAAVATKGIALIAKIVLAIHSAYGFAKKIANATELRAMKK